MSHNENRDGGSAKHNGDREKPYVPRRKRTVPELPDGFVSRPRLLNALDRAGPEAATMVCAPAGSGKTLVLAEWVRAGGLGGAAWLSLDAADNDERRFRSGVLDALVPAVPELKRLDASSPGFFADLIDALDTEDARNAEAAEAARDARDPRDPGNQGILPAEPVRLVLDDVHELVATEPLRDVEQLLRLRPRGLRLVLSTRWDPPLPLARLRLSGRLADLRSDHLRFRPDEAAALLAGERVHIGPEQVDRLVTRTEGWASGLRLAAESLKGGAEFTGTDPIVSAYLVDEVLAPLSEEEREFLREISVCERVSASLATALSGRVDAGELLARLEHRTAMLFRTGAGRRIYRLHTLLRAHLLTDLMLRTPRRVPALHRRAAEWLRARHQAGDAVTHALEAGDSALVADLLRRHALDLLLAGEHDVLRRARAALSDDVVGDDPWLALTGALEHLDAARPGAARAQVTLAERAWPREPSRELHALRGLVGTRFAHAAGYLEEDVTEDVAEQGSALSAMTLLESGQALLAAGRAAEARRPVESALAFARAHGHAHLEQQCLTVLAGVAAATGDFRAMAALAEDADTLAETHGWRDTPAGAKTSLILACGALMRAEALACLAQVDRVTRVLATTDTLGHAGLTLLTATLDGTARFDCGQRSVGLRRMTDARLAEGPAPLPDGVVAFAAVCEHDAATRLGRGETARDVLAWARERIPTAAEILLIRAGTQVVLGRDGHARNLLRPLLDGAIEPLLPWTPITAWLLEAEIAVRGGEAVRARRAVAKALGPAERLGVLRPLVTAAPEVLDLALLDVPGGHRFTTDLRQARALRGRQPDAVALTERERTVLRLLPTIRSLDEIAGDLMVSPNTVKTHVRALYRKLGVGSRREAVRSAVRRGLVDN
ncbi:LuxR C-terminal-related transcriptional regulator [Amycolatopsis rhabdoformis]|uniref:LuxR C-terminal-related transcriptional regulator n=1 Tax=Amycolatopsis rhabdoformis TaxID=1448059 RepID=A0ABZ1ILE6_9PSEU|nr:LuxR C-terminal-related transcriptional regulator [Amycolatopsis rhabdoformis]WSE34608.1 LuxR C-terminal-related transcriptional regulator [Amycolatopsis rhabdoformis]